MRAWGAVTLLYDFAEEDEDSEEDEGEEEEGEEETYPLSLIASSILAALASHTTST